MVKRGQLCTNTLVQNEHILRCFTVPKTPRQVEKELNISKIKPKFLVENGLLKLLNPATRKGRLYILTDLARAKLGLKSMKIPDLDWEILGWIIGSPSQRMAVLKTISLDTISRSSEEIRKRAARFNSLLTRISTKEILKELISKNLVETKLKDRRRSYKIIEKGLEIHQQLSEHLTGLYCYKF